MGGRHRKRKHTFQPRIIGMYGAVFGAVVSMTVALIQSVPLPAYQAPLALAIPPTPYQSPSPSLTEPPEPSESQTRAPVTRSTKSSRPSPSPRKRILLETTTEAPLPTLPTTRNPIPTIPTTKPTPTRPTTPRPIPKPPTSPPLKSNPKCAIIGLQPNALKGCNAILSVFPEITNVLGVGERASNPTSCHPRGLAIDLMVYTDKALGDRVYAYVKAHQDELGAYSYAILWQVPSHYDHVHVSFLPCEG